MPAPDPTPTPLELLQRAQFLHDSTLRRHSDALERHDIEVLLLRQMSESQLRTQHHLRDLHTRLTDNQLSFSATMAQQTARLSAVEAATLQMADAILRITATLDAIKDLLGRANGH